MSSATADRVDAIVIGAGISGLAAATELAKAGCRTIVLEKSRGIGGRMAARRQHPVQGADEIRSRVHECAVQIEGDGPAFKIACVHRHLPRPARMG